LQHATIVKKVRFKERFIFVELPWAPSRLLANDDDDGRAMMIILIRGVNQCGGENRGYNPAGFMSLCVLANLGAIHSFLVAMCAQQVAQLSSIVRGHTISGQFVEHSQDLTLDGTSVLLPYFAQSCPVIGPNGLIYFCLSLSIYHLLICLLTFRKFGVFA